MGRGGEIYLFDMGQPVKIFDLAEELIKLSGMKPHEDIEIVFTGLRPGEKLYEELLLAEEGVLPTHHEKICVVRSVAPDADLLKRYLDNLIAAAKNLDLVAVRKGLKQIVLLYPQLHHETEAKVIPHPASVMHQ